MAGIPPERETPEVVRGTPLLLQLYVIFYMLPKIDQALALKPKG